MIAGTQFIDEVGERLNPAVLRVAGGCAGNRRIEKDAARAQLSSAGFQSQQLQAGIAELPLGRCGLAQLGIRLIRGEKQIRPAWLSEAALQFREVQKDGERRD